MKPWMYFLIFFPILCTFSFALPSTPWGWHTVIDLEDCNPDLIRSRNHIEAYLVSLCELIDMKRYGPCQIVHFDEEERVAGFSMYQLIETSNISAHFANASNAAYIDIFSCKKYDVRKAVDFTADAFRGNLKLVRLICR